MLSRRFREEAGSHGWDGHKLQRGICVPFKGQKCGVPFGTYKDATEWLLKYGVGTPYLDEDGSTSFGRVLLGNYTEIGLRLGYRADIWYDMTLGESISHMPPSSTLPAGMILGFHDDRVEVDEGGDSGVLNQFSYLKLSSGQAGGPGIRMCSGGGNGDGNWKGKGSSLKRSVDQISSADGEGGGQDEDSPSDQPNKKSRGNKDPIKGLRLPNNRRPFACPFFKNSAIDNPDCAKWNDLRILQVKEHCKACHLKHLRCGRCKKFRAGNHEEIMEHLEKENCEKSEGPESSEGGSRGDTEKAIDLDKAKTWQRIYEILFPLSVPSPFWEDQAQVSAGPIYSLQRPVPVTREYRSGLAEFLGSRLPFEPEVVDNLLSEYDKNWTLKSQPTLVENVCDVDSGIEHDHLIAGYHSFDAFGAQPSSGAEGPLENFDIDDFIHEFDAGGSSDQSGYSAG